MENLLTWILSVEMRLMVLSLLLQLVNLFFFTVTPLHTQEHLISVLIKQIKIYSFEKHRRRHCKKNTINTLDWGNVDQRPWYAQHPEGEI